MNNSRWKANRIGLINFWYYDDQEFAFADGKMLLRGSNGSGKSVTMQSVIPLLLDGNMSPERLDPFGSRDRKMSSYLLEEEDSREERTGYLYLEFKRADSQTYFTIGMGMRARKGKPMDKWYFSLSDGRRVGKDFFLYKETDEKITLSKKELSNRVQEGGRIFDGQKEYMEYVNKHIFGFETPEEYKEMIDLLIQLRTPKLSKDFKPSVINDILSDSLQPLSDDDLRPMSEAIENMDAMNMNLKSRKEAKQAAEKIYHVFDSYNRVVLYQKAKQLRHSQVKMQQLKRLEKEKTEEKSDCESRIQILEQDLAAMESRQVAMEQEKESLRESDATKLKERELELIAEIGEGQKVIKEKEKQLEGKKEQQRQANENLKAAEEDRYLREKEIGQILEELGDDAEEMAFEEHYLFEKEFLANLEESADFDTHQAQMDLLGTRIRDCLRILRSAQSLQEQVDEQLQRREKKKRETEDAKKETDQAETVLIQSENEWKEALYTWNGSNHELKLTQDLLKEFAHFAENYGETSDFSYVKDSISDVWLEGKGRLDQEQSQLKEQETQILEEYEVLKKELAQWEALMEPVPERSEEVLRNRSRLQKLKIPYQEFYKVLEFGPALAPQERDLLEEALLKMGILDALIIEERYRKQVLAMDKGCADRYLFLQKGRAEKSLMDVLELNDSANDIFTNPRVTGILQSIAYEAEGETAIFSEGVYRIGALTGTLSGEYKAGFLGTHAREENRLRQMELCRSKMSSLEEDLSSLREEISTLKARMIRLQEEYESFPKEQDMKTALNMVLKQRRLEEQLEEELLRMDSQLKILTLKLAELRSEAVKLSEKLALSCRLDVFQRAEESFQNYSKCFYKLRACWEGYSQRSIRCRELAEHIENLEDDMDQIRYDRGRSEGELHRCNELLRSVREQLELTNYEEIRERLQQCMKWLQEYPSKLARALEEKGRKSEQSRNLESELQTISMQIEEARTQGEYFNRIFEMEMELEYIPQLSQGQNEKKTEAKDVCDILEAAEGLKEQEAVIRDLNKVYYENRGFLSDYQLIQEEIFDMKQEEIPEGAISAKRLDLSARYQGVKIPFVKLLSHLTAEIEELQDLIKAGDRELFEDILGNTVSRKIRSKINNSNAWVKNMNALMESMNTSSGLRLSLRWRSRTAENEEQLDTHDLVELLKKDYRLMREEESERLSAHFRSKVEEARRRALDSGGQVSFYQVMRETLDYRKWFEFQLFFRKGMDRQKELTNSVFGTFSGGEKAMAMYVPLFSAVVAKYQGGRIDAPRLISLDEAFAGVDNRNIRDMFRLMREFQFDFIINSQVLWGDCDTIDALAIYQLVRPENAKFVTVMPYLWNGTVREMIEDETTMEERIEGLS